VTTQMATLFTNATARPKLVQFLTDVGIRSGDALYQILAPSQSEFTRQPERARQLRQFANTNETPGNAYGFDDGRFAVLLEQRGFGVEEIALGGATFLEAATVQLLGQHCPFLRLVDLSSCFQLTGDDVTAALARSRASLRLLNVGHLDAITGKALDAILPGLVNLVALCLPGLNRLTAADDYAFHHIGAMRSLRVLDVSFCSTLGDGPLVAAAQGCPCLEYLDMRGCMGVTDVAVAAVASFSTQLRCWRLSYCTRVTAAGVMLLTRTARRLEILSLDGMGSGVLSEPVLAAAIERGRNLALLSVAGAFNAHLSDASLANITRCCPALQVLDLSGGRAFSIGALTALIHDLKQLRRLVLNASGLSPDQTSLLRMVKQTVQIVDCEPDRAAPARIFGIKQPPPPPPPPKNAKPKPN
jgi:hypothetical protein